MMTKEGAMMKGKAIGAKDPSGKECIQWAVDTSGESWTTMLGLAPRHGAEAAETIKAIIRAAGFEAVEVD